MQGGKAKLLALYKPGCILHEVCAGRNCCACLVDLAIEVLAACMHILLRSQPCRQHNISRLLPGLPHDQKESQTCMPLHDGV